MTVQYIQHMHSSKAFLFLRLLFRWRGGMIKIVWLEMIILSALYITVSLVYRLALTKEMQSVFENVVTWTNGHLSLVPVVFILSFYISATFKRFWTYYRSIPWTTNLALTTAHFLKKADAGDVGEAEAVRWRILRKCNAAFVLCCRHVSRPVRKRFPDLQALVKEKLLSKAEVKALEEVDAEHPKYFVPLSWAASDAMEAEKAGLVRTDFGLDRIVEEIGKLRDGYQTIVHFDFVALPLVYTQVVTIAVYSYVLMCVIGRQYFIESSKNNPENYLDLRVPIFTVVEVMMYLACLKLSQSMMNPMGSGDNDFEMNNIIDYCIKTSKTIISSKDFRVTSNLSDWNWDSGDAFDLPLFSKKNDTADAPALGDT